VEREQKFDKLMVEQDIIKEEKLRENKYVTAMLEEEVKK
jgi:hypothetical protein